MTAKHKGKTNKEAWVLTCKTEPPCSNTGLPVRQPSIEVGNSRGIIKCNAAQWLSKAMFMTAWLYFVHGSLMFKEAWFYGLLHVAKHSMSFWFTLWFFFKHFKRRGSEANAYMNTFFSGTFSNMKVGRILCRGILCIFVKYFFVPCAVLWSYSVRKLLNETCKVIKLLVLQCPRFGIFLACNYRFSLLD